MEAVIAVMDRPWEWGRSDCCASACDVFERLHGIDPMRGLRGRYASRGEAEALIAARGGFAAMAASLASLAGLRTGCGAPGEIGLSPEGAASGGRCLMIRTGPLGWAAKTARGFALVPEAELCWRA